jgi:hypothetical protein
MDKITIIETLDDDSCLITTKIDGHTVKRSSSSLKAHSFYRNLRGHIDIQYSESELRKIQTPKGVSSKSNKTAL